MPRNGSGVYNHPFPDVVEGTTIESAVFNGNTSDVEQDLNTPRPIVAGGTGANNAHDAMIALSGEIANQVVTNYDTFPFVPGSLYSVPGATAGPPSGGTTTDYFTGIYYEAGPGSRFIEVRANTTGIKYVRQYLSSAWLPWKQQPGSVADLDAAYVNAAGDTMSGGLSVPQLSVSGASGIYVGANGAINCTGSISLNTGSPTALLSFSNLPNKYLQYDGTNFNFVGGPVYTPSLISNGAVYSGAAGTNGSYYFGQSGTKYLNYDGTNFNLVGGTMVTSGAVVNGTASVSTLWATSGGVWSWGATVTTGFYYFGNTGTKSLGYDGTSFNLVGGGLNVTHANGLAVSAGPISCQGNITVGNGTINLTNATTYVTGDGTNMLLRVALGGNATISNSTNGAAADLHCAAVYCTGINTGGGLAVTNGYTCRAGNGGGVGSSFNIMWSPATLWIDTTNVGAFAFTSDYRVKKDVIDLPGMWDTVKALRPIKYTQAQFSPPSHIKHIAAETLKAREEAEENPEAKPREVNTAPLFEADDVERWGFIAHELQETLTPSASSGEKDSPDTIQSPNPFTVIAALTKALQEAMTRIEALEGGAARR
jgi:hypothetical protein